MAFLGREQGGLQAGSAGLSDSGPGDTATAHHASTTGVQIVYKAQNNGSSFAYL